MIYRTVRLWSIANTTFTVYRLNSSYGFAHHSEVHFGRNLFPEAISDAEKVIELNPLFHHGYELKHAAPHGARRYDEATEAFKIMLSKLDDTPDLLLTHKDDMGPK